MLGQLAMTGRISRASLWNVRASSTPRGCILTVRNSSHERDSKEILRVGSRIATKDSGRFFGTEAIGTPVDAQGLDSRRRRTGALGIGDDDFDYRTGWSNGAGVDVGAGDGVGTRGRGAQAFDGSARHVGGFREAAGRSFASSTLAHMPRGEDQLQKMARQSLLHELWQEQQRTHEFAVDWFLNNMPGSYFRQTTEEARLQHLGAIAAMLEPQSDCGKIDVKQGEVMVMDMDMAPTKDVTLHFERFQGRRKEVTFIQPGSKSRHDGILAMLEALPPADGTLQRVHVFPSRDGNLSINVLGYELKDNVNGNASSPVVGILPSRMRTDRSKDPTGAEGASLAKLGKDATVGGVGDKTVAMREAWRPNGELFEYAASVQAGEWKGDPMHPPPGPMFEPEALLEYVSRCEADFVQHSHPRRFCKHRMLYEEVRGTEGVAVDVEAYEGSEAGVYELHGSHWISLAAANVLPKVALSQALRLLKSHGLETIRCHLDVVDDPGNGSVTIVRLLVSDRKRLTAPGRGDGHPGAAQQPGSGGPGSLAWDRLAAWECVKKDLRRLKWLDERVYELALEKHPDLGLDRSEVIVTLANMVYGALHKKNPWAYSKSQIYQWLDNPRYVKHASAIADFFRDRFSPFPEEPTSGAMTQAEAEERADGIRAVIRRDVEHEVVQVMLEKMVDAVLATYRTNFFMPNRWALSLRVDPRVLMTPKELEGDTGAAIPFGVFFVHGRRFNGFHCRFRDIARGGMRIVTPPTSEQVAIESGRQFDECYGLAYAQQLKNKDIPEGGSKAVLLVDTTHSAGRAKHYAVRKGVKAFSDALLDLLVNTEETNRYVKDLWGKQELLYLGPDEQVIPQDIDWIIARAAQREASFPSAFMSSKPDAGINHKEFGVTSEGVFVFLQEALRDAGIDAKSGQKFTVKLTGGPDGDVGGNMIKILNREFGETCLIVGVADGTGSAEDPDGLSHEELLRLFQEAKSISEYRTSKLGPNGVLHTCDTEEGIRARNSMHNRVKADAFVPAGGRPNTINTTNWRLFLDENGQPSSRLVVEGANLFTTTEARKLLFEEAGVVFVKDSSANKCGVICSSFEIISSMLMASEEFKENKEAIVSDVLERLRDVGRREAELLFREHRNHPATPLPKISERISNAINAVTDATLKILDDASPGEQEEHMKLLLPLFREHLPAKLAELAFDRVPSTLPPQYLRNAMASCLACRVVYTEGINFIDAQPRSRLGELALNYIREEAVVRKLADVVESTSPDTSVAMTEEEKDKVVQILRSAGVRASLGIY